MRSTACFPKLPRGNLHRTGTTETIASDSQTLARRLQEQKDLNLRAIRAKLDGEISDDDFKVMKANMTEEMDRVQKAIGALDTEQSSFKSVMAQAEQDVLNFKEAWLAGNTQRKREIQNALFPEGLQFRHKKFSFKPGSGLDIHDLGSILESYLNIGVPDGI
jgi:hypothetical protein